MPNYKLNPKYARIQFFPHNMGDGRVVNLTGRFVKKIPISPEYPNGGEVIYEAPTQKDFAQIVKAGTQDMVILDHQTTASLEPDTTPEPAVDANNKSAANVGK